MSNHIFITNKIKSFNKNIKVSSDKSISIRWALLASQAIGISKAKNLLKSEDVVNTFELIDFGGQGSFDRFALFVNQYRLKPEHTKLLAKEMKNLSLSEFNLLLKITMLE